MAAYGFGRARIGGAERQPDAVQAHRRVPPHATQHVAVLSGFRSPQYNARGGGEGMAQGEDEHAGGEPELASRHLDGRVVGTWKRAFKQGGVVMTAYPFAALTDAEQTGFAQAAVEYAAFLGMRLIETIDHA